MRQRYIAVGGHWVPANEAAAEKESNSPYIQGVLKPFISMIDGKEVTSLLQYRADLRAHGYVEVGNETKYLKTRPPIPEVDPQQRRELIVAQIREMGYEGMKKALRKDIEFSRWNSRKG
jgi:hypothetical protein